MGDTDGGFLSRWARRKAQAREGALPPEPAPAPTPAVVAATTAPAAVASPPVPAATAVAPPPAEPPPTLDDVAQLTRESHFGRFVQPDVDPAVKNAALKKLFADPQFNVMDGLDTYIDDYGKPDPLPASMLRQMAQAKFLGLFDDDDDEQPPAATAPAAAATAATVTPDAVTPPPLPNEDTDLRLQPHDAARRPGAEPGPEPHGGGEC